MNLRAYFCHAFQQKQRETNGRNVEFVTQANDVPETIDARMSKTKEDLINLPFKQNQRVLSPAVDFLRLQSVIRHQMEYNMHLRQIRMSSQVDVTNFQRRVWLKRRMLQKSGLHIWVWGGPQYPGSLYVRRHTPRNARRITPPVLTPPLPRLTESSVPLPLLLSA